MDPLDIKNDKYLYWDANGRAVQISVSDQRVTGMAYGETEFSLTEAFKRFSDVHGLGVDTTGPVDQVWGRLKQGENPLPRSRGLLPRLFRKHT